MPRSASLPGQHAGSPGQEHVQHPEKHAGDDHEQEHRERGHAGFLPRRPHDLAQFDARFDHERPERLAARRSAEHDDGEGDTGDPRQPALPFGLRAQHVERGDAAEYQQDRHHELGRVGAAAGMVIWDRFIHRVDRRLKSNIYITEAGRPGGNRTPNLRFWRPPLCQLSYWPAEKSYFRTFATTPAPTVLPPSRMAKRRPSSIAIGLISSTLILMLSPGMIISTPSGN